MECLKVFGIDGPAEHCNDLIAENQINRAQHQTADNGHYNGVSDTLFGGIRLFSSETQADKSTAAVTDHHCNSQCDDCQGKHNGICGVPIRTKVSGIRDEDLVNDIVESPDKKGNNTGNRIFSHQLADMPFPKEMIWFFFHCKIHPFKK